MSAVWQWLTDRNWKTWLGHALLGALIGALGVAARVDDVGISYAVVCAFLYRELSDLAMYFVTPVAERTKPLGEKLVDGFFDLWAPVLGCVLAVLLLR